MITLMFHGSSVLFMRVCIFDCSGTRGPVHEFVLSEVWSASVPMGANRGRAGQGEVGSPAPLLIGSCSDQGEGPQEVRGPIGLSMCHSDCSFQSSHLSGFLVYIYIQANLAKTLMEYVASLVKNRR